MILLLSINSPDAKVLNTIKCQIVTAMLGLNNHSFKIALCYALCLVFAGFVLFYGLDDRLLWGDEAETALLAQNITKYGIPKADDGKNKITLYNGADLNEENIWTLSPWLDEYLAAASFILFGKSTFSARFPFALLGFVSVLLLGWTCYSIFKTHEISLISTVLTISNVAFLLHVRQCRYYSLIIFAQILLIYGYYQIVIKKSLINIFFVAFALTIQFYCNYLALIPNIPALIISAITGKARNPNLYKKLFLSLIIFCFFAGPWLIYAEPWRSTGKGAIKSVSILLSFLPGFPNRVLYRLLHFNFYIMPVVILLMPLIYLFFKKNSQKAVPHTQARSIYKLLWIVLLIYFTWISFLPPLFFRYITPLIPVGTLLATIILYYFVREMIFRWILICIMIFTNVLSTVSALPLGRPKKISLPLVTYVREITTPYKDRFGDVLSYLKKNGNSNETVFVYDSEFPLIFYTDMKIIDGRFLKPNINKVDFNGIPYGSMPDWILEKSASGISDRTSIRHSEKIKKYYEEIRLKVHGTNRHASRPDPTKHVAFSAEEKEIFKMYRKRKK